MAREGLRTLVVAKKALTEEQYAYFEVELSTEAHFPLPLPFIWGVGYKLSNRILIKNMFESSMVNHFRSVVFYNLMGWESCDVNGWNSTFF